MMHFLNSEADISSDRIGDFISSNTAFEDEYYRLKSTNIFGEDHNILEVSQADSVDPTLLQLQEPARSSCSRESTPLDRSSWSQSRPLADSFTSKSLLASAVSSKRSPVGESSKKYRYPDDIVKSLVNSFASRLGPLFSHSSTSNVSGGSVECIQYQDQGTASRSPSPFIKEDSTEKQLPVCGDWLHRLRHRKVFSKSHQKGPKGDLHNDPPTPPPERIFAVERVTDSPLAGKNKLDTSMETEMRTPSDGNIELSLGAYNELLYTSGRDIVGYDTSSGSREVRDPSYGLGIFDTDVLMPSIHPLGKELGSSDISSSIANDLANNPHPFSMVTALPSPAPSQKRSYEEFIDFTTNENTVNVSPSRKRSCEDFAPRKEVDSTISPELARKRSCTDFQRPTIANFQVTGNDFPDDGDISTINASSLDMGSSISCYISSPDSSQGRFYPTSVTTPYSISTQVSEEDLKHNMVRHFTVPSTGTLQNIVPLSPSPSPNVRNTMYLDRRMSNLEDHLPIGGSSSHGGSKLRHIKSFPTHFLHNKASSNFAHSQNIGDIYHISQFDKRHMHSQYLHQQLMHQQERQQEQLKNAQIEDEKRYRFRQVASSDMGPTALRPPPPAMPQLNMTQYINPVNPSAGMSMASAKDEVTFVNFTQMDKEKILKAVAPSGSARTKERRERERREKLEKLQKVGGIAATTEDI
ncbi:hypothetical protein V1511DRAFT_493676 [Dipodascopsis uninucleata]